MIERIILGCHNLTGGSSYLRSKRLIDAAFDLGVRRFDVAPSYGLGTAEATLSRALGSRRLREEVEITTKFGILPPRFGTLKTLAREPYKLLNKLRPRKAPDQATAAKVAPPPPPRHADFPLSATEAARRSLRALRVERLDCFLIHERLPEAGWSRYHDELLELKHRGVVGRIGVSGAPGNVADMIAVVPLPDIVQLPFSAAAAAPPSKELRLFNLVPAARARLGGMLSDEALATELASIVKEEASCFPDRSFLFNTGSRRRLELFVGAMNA